MKFLIIVLLSILPCITFAQSAEKMANGVIVAKSEISSFAAVADSLARTINDNTVFLMGETHSIKANEMIFLPLVKELNRQKGVNYILMEMNHSLYFGYNLFLKYGDVKILADFEGLKSRDTNQLNLRFKTELDLYEYNLNLPVLKKIQFIGVDLDISNIPSYRPMTQYHYVTAMRYFKKYAIDSLPHDISFLIDEITTANDPKTLIKMDARLRTLAFQYKNELKRCFGEFYKDFYLINNSFKIYPMGSRDGDMLDNFENAYGIIKALNPSAVPKFFGSFGAMHVKPGKNGSFASRVSRSNLVDAGVSFIGVSYFNTKSNYGKELKTVDKSSLGGLSKEEQVIANSFLRNISEQQGSPIVLLGRFSTLPKGELDFLKGFDSIFVFTGF